LRREFLTRFHLLLLFLVFFLTGLLLLLDPREVISVSPPHLIIILRLILLTKSRRVLAPLVAIIMFDFLGLGLLTELHVIRLFKGLGRADHEVLAQLEVRPVQAVLLVVGGVAHGLQGHLDAGWVWRALLHNG